MTTAASIQLYTRTTAQWTSSPDNAVVLLPGQIGVELLATGRFSIKIGNGVDTWNVLTYIQSDILESIRQELDGLRTGRSWKQVVRGASTANITPLSGGLTADNINYNNHEYVLLKDQTNPVENGIWRINVTGAWSRREDFDNQTDMVSGATVRAVEGSINKNKEFTCINTDPVVVGTDPINFIDSTGQSYVNEITIDITGATNIDLTGYGNYGIINLTSSNATETINNITNYNSSTKVMLRPATGLAITFNDASVAAGNIHLDDSATTKVINGSNAGYLEVQLRASEYYQTGFIKNYN